MRNDRKIPRVHSQYTYTSKHQKLEQSNINYYWAYTERKIGCGIMHKTNDEISSILVFLTVYDMCHFIKIIFIFSKILLFFPKYFYFIQNNFIFSKFFLILSNYFHFFQTILIFSKLFKYISFWFPPKYPLDFCQKLFLFFPNYLNIFLFDFRQNIRLIFAKKNFIFAKKSTWFLPKRILFFQKIRLIFPQNNFIFPKKSAWFLPKRILFLPKNPPDFYQK